MNSKEKSRCWRLCYKDELSFHMDGVPSIPENQEQRLLLEERMAGTGFDTNIARAVAHHAGAITDNRLANYSMIRSRLAGQQFRGIRYLVRVANEACAATNGRAGDGRAGRYS